MAPRGPRSARRQTNDESVVIALVGEGRGKSAAAFGYVNRAWARGWSPAVVQFMKGQQWNREQIMVAQRLGIAWHTFAPGLTWASDPDEGFATKARAAWETVRLLLAQPEHGLVVLDEISHAFDRDWLPPDEVMTALRERPRGTNVILTGRVLPPELLAISDTVTEFGLIRLHQRGILG